MIQNKKKFSEKEEALLNQIMASIKKDLPEGYSITNLYPVQKHIRKTNSSTAETYWTCWVKKDNIRCLALLKGNRVKLIHRDELKDYQMHTLHP